MANLRGRIAKRSLERAHAASARAPAVAPDLLDAVRRYAPRIHMQTTEEWFPSSVSNFLNYVTLEGVYYTTNDPLSSPSDGWWDGAAGMRPDEFSVPIYAFVSEGKRESADCPTGSENTFTDILYFAFFPYNRGKRVCMGPYLDNYCAVYCPPPFDSDCCVPRIDGCSTDYTVFGNHVGDWEHVTVRLQRNLETGYTPVWVVGSAHGRSNRISWEEVGKSEEHPIVYEALGSHGMYFSIGCDRYEDLPNGDFLQDCRDDGIAWDTWNNIVVVQGEQNNWSCTGHNGTENAENCTEWLNHVEGFRWGNPADGCGVLDVFEVIAGECRLNPGPIGPNGKSFIWDPNKCD